MSFEHNLDYVQNFSHLTRWVAPLPPVHLQYHADTPNKVSIDKTKKMSNAKVPFTFIPSYRHPNRHTDA